MAKKQKDETKYELDREIIDELIYDISIRNWRRVSINGDRIREYLEEREKQGG